MSIIKVSMASGVLYIWSFIQNDAGAMATAKTEVFIGL